MYCQDFHLWEVLPSFSFQEPPELFQAPLTCAQQSFWNLPSQHLRCCLHFSPWLVLPFTVLHVITLFLLFLHFVGVHPLVASWESQTEGTYFCDCADLKMLLFYPHTLFIWFIYSLSGSRIQHWKLFSFRILKALLHCLPASCLILVGSHFDSWVCMTYLFSWKLREFFFYGPYYLGTSQYYILL